jgi:ATP/ADP translocase
LKKKKKEKVETEVESSKIIKGHSVKSSSSSTATATTATTSSSSSTSSTSTSSSTNNEENVLKTALKLFKRVPILGAMFCEVLIAQCLSSLLNFQFMTEVKNTILNDDERAGFTGNVSLLNMWFGL